MGGLPSAKKLTTEKINKHNEEYLRDYPYIRDPVPTIEISVVSSIREGDL